MKGNPVKVDNKRAGGGVEVGHVNDAQIEMAGKIDLLILIPISDDDRLCILFILFNFTSSSAVLFFHFYFSF